MDTANLRLQAIQTSIEAHLEAKITSLLQQTRSVRSVSEELHQNEVEIIELESMQGSSAHDSSIDFGAVKEEIFRLKGHREELLHRLETLAHELGTLP